MEIQVITNRYIGLFMRRNVSISKNRTKIERLLDWKEFPSKSVGRFSFQCLTDDSVVVFLVFEGGYTEANPNDYVCLPLFRGASGNSNGGRVSERDRQADRERERERKIRLLTKPYFVMLKSRLGKTG